MKYKISNLFFLLWSCFVVSSCQQFAKPEKSEFINQLTQLKEFKRSEKIIDSISKSRNEPLEIGVDIVKDPPEDSNKNFSIGYINLNRGIDHIILYIVKFDKNSQKIISVDKNKTGSSLDYLGWPIE